MLTNALEHHAITAEERRRQVERHALTESLARAQDRYQAQADVLRVLLANIESS